MQLHLRIIRDDGILCVLALVRLDGEVAVEVDVIATHGCRLVWWLCGWWSKDRTGGTYERLDCSIGTYDTSLLLGYLVP
jgi:hypothetical protein